MSGNLGASANTSPPKPHPMSAISTFLLSVFTAVSFSSSCDLSLSTAYVGYKLAQSISAGLFGLYDT